MLSRKTRHGCSVVGCTEPHVSLHRLPAREDVRARWLHFIYRSNVPASGGKSALVCAKHFTADCFSNQGQFNAGLATRLFLKDGSVPTVRDADDGMKADGHLRSPSGVVVHHVACQTDKLKTCTAATQLAMGTLRPHFRSKGTSTTECSTSPPSISKKPHKRARLDLDEEEEQENPLEGSSSTDDPAFDSADVKLEASSLHDTPTYIVEENCLLELFEVCPACQRVSEVKTRRVGSLISVEQMCPNCQFFRIWNNQPII